MKAPRLSLRFWRGVTRSAGLVLSLWLAGAAAAQDRVPAHCIEEIVGAEYDDATNRYPHGVLGDDLEWGSLRIGYRTTLACRSGSGGIRVTLPEELVFEDVAPRIVDLDGQGVAEIVVVESHQQRGARLVVWGVKDGDFTRLAATPFIGRRFRWLAPLGAADLDGDGVTELAFVDRPHLAKTLRIWRYEDARLVEVARLGGVTNHRIGETDIAGGIRDCGSGPEMILADSTWREVLSLRFDGQIIQREVLGSHRGRQSFATAMGCRSLR